MFYVSIYSKHQQAVEVECPACSARQMIRFDEFEAERWVTTCSACGAIFGVVAPALFRTYVSNRWFNQAEAKRAPEPTYIDFIIRDFYNDGRVMLERWHGWVDRETRHVVQEG